MLQKKSKNSTARTNNSNALQQVEYGYGRCAKSPDQMCETNPTRKVDFLVILHFFFTSRVRTPDNKIVISTEKLGARGFGVLHKSFFRWAYHPSGGIRPAAGKPREKKNFVSNFLWNP